MFFSVAELRYRFFLSKSPSVVVGVMTRDVVKLAQAILRGSPLLAARLLESDRRMAVPCDRFSPPESPTPLD